MLKFLYETGNTGSKGSFIPRINKVRALLNEISSIERFQHLQCSFGSEIGINQVFLIAGQKLIQEVFFQKNPAFRIMTHKLIFFRKILDNSMGNLNWISTWKLLGPKVTQERTLPQLSWTTVSLSLCNVVRFYKVRFDVFFFEKEKVRGEQFTNYFIA